MTTVNAYLTFNGNCEAAFDFYKSVFGGEYPHVGRFGDMPPQKGMPPIPEEDKNKIMHMSLSISEETIIMGSDTLDSWGDDYKTGNNFSLSVNPETIDEADAIFIALSADGEVKMDLEITFWGSYFGILTDQFGINWMINLPLDQT
jgi:PhnB protein